MGANCIVGKRAIIGAFCTIGDDVHLYENVCIGPNVQIDKGVILYKDVNVGKNVSISDFSSINKYTIIDCGHIGRFSSIGPSCHIGAGKHAVEYISSSQSIYGRNNILDIDNINFNAFDVPPVIGNDVWIGSHVVVLQGLTIGDGAVIGAGSVVTKSVEPYSIVGGVPAQLIRKRFDEKRIKHLLELCLWEKYDENKELIKKMILQKENWD